MDAGKSYALCIGDLLSAAMQGFQLIQNLHTCWEQRAHLPAPNKLMPARQRQAPELQQQLASLQHFTPWPTQLHVHCLLHVTHHTCIATAGKAIKGQREKFTIATKCGIVINDGKMSYDGSRKHVREACEGSLKRLGIDTIDLYYLHR
jgi:hypothetical protein